MAKRTPKNRQEYTDFDDIFDESFVTSPKQESRKGLNRHAEEDLNNLLNDEDFDTFFEDDDFIPKTSSGKASANSAAKYSGSSAGHPSKSSHKKSSGNSYRSSSGKHTSNKKKKGGAGKVVAIILIIVAVLVIAFCAYKLITIQSGYKQAEDVYKEIEEIFDDNGGDPNVTNWTFDYDKLKAMNSDAVGYIFQTGVMSYPILQGATNDTYLRTMINGTYNDAGSIFVDCDTEGALNNRYALVYGHNMNDTSMFGSLKYYTDESYYQEHKEFDVYCEDRHYKYYVFSSFIASVDSDIYDPYIYSDEDFLNRAYWMRSQCPYETDINDFSADDHIIILVTCKDMNHDYSVRRVVCLKRGEEIID